MSDLLRESAEHESLAKDDLRAALQALDDDRPMSRVNFLMLRAIYAQNAAILCLLRGKSE